MSTRLYLTEGGGSIKDGSVVWQIQDIRETTPVGTIRVALCVINGYLMCDGREVSREKYNKLVAFADKNNLWTEDKENYPGLFGGGDKKTTFALPNLMNRMVQLMPDETGKKIDAGLPNITGSAAWDPRLWSGGAFSNIGTGNHCELCDGRDGAYQGISFDASRSNKIYGNSETVQPPAVKMIPIIKY